jgi:hypothetical protein
MIICADSLHYIYLQFTGISTLMAIEIYQEMHALQSFVSLAGRYAAG